MVLRFRTMVVNVAIMQTLESPERWASRSEGGKLSSLSYWVKPMCHYFLTGMLGFRNGERDLSSKKYSLLSVSWLWMSCDQLLQASASLTSLSRWTVSLNYEPKWSYLLLHYFEIYILSEYSDITDIFGFKPCSNESFKKSSQVTLIRKAASCLFIF